MRSLLLLPGFMCDARLFGPQMDLLSMYANVSVRIPTERSAAEMGAAALASVEDPIWVAGLSMGGIVALEMLRQAPDRIAGLALLDTTPLADAPENHAIRTRQVAEVHRGGLDRIMREELKPAYLAETGAKSAILDLCLAMARDLGPDIFEAQSLALRDRDDLCAGLARAPARTLILSGAGDRLCPPGRSDLMHRLAPHAMRVDIPAAGHLPVLENPTDTNSALLGWLEKG